MPLTGIGGKDAEIATSAAEVVIHSLIDPTAKVKAEFLVRRRLTDRLPSRNLVEVDLSEFGDLTLADPNFDKSECIDIIIGADTEGHFAKAGFRKSASSALITRDTILGWVFTGPPPPIRARRAVKADNSSAQVFHVAIEEDIQEFLLKFWELEEIPKNSGALSANEQLCEDQFSKAHYRDGEGRFVVQLPFKSRPTATGTETSRIALGSLNSLHKRFVMKPELHTAYNEFMQQYESLGHMSRIPENELDNPNSWYLPHHAVVQERPEGIKIRVVFDAARKIQSGTCLNDYLMPEPPLQQDLGLILANWRRYRFTDHPIPCLRPHNNFP